MQGRIKLLIAGASVAVAASAGTGIAIAGSSASSDDAAQRQIMGTEFDRASAAALAYTGGGRVSDTEKGDEESLYQVEVTLDDGRHTDVNLDQAFAVVGSKTEAPGS